MTGPEHYREAERDLDRSQEASISDGTAAYYLSSAQVHATLALAAATALAPVREMTQAEWPAWCEVAATKRGVNS